MVEMAAATANCVSTTCCSITSAREGHGRQQGAGSAAASLPRTAFCGEKVAPSLKAQALLPAPTLRRSPSMPARLQVSSVLAERVDQTVSIHCSNVEILSQALWSVAEVML